MLRLEKLPDDFQRIPAQGRTFGALTDQMSRQGGGALLGVQKTSEQGSKTNFVVPPRSLVVEESDMFIVLEP